MAKWHITITENETGNTRLDIDTDAIIAGIDEGERTHVIHMTDCRVTDHAAAICGVLGSIKEARKENPILDFLVELWEKQEPKRAETVEGGQA